MANTSTGEPANLGIATTATDEAAGSAERKEKTERDFADLIEEAAAGMRRLMAAMPGSGTGEAQDAQEAVSRLFEGVMATNKRFAEELLNRVEPGPAVEPQRQFLGEWFDALARGGTLLLRAAGEAAGKSQERQARGHGGGLRRPTHTRPGGCCHDRAHGRHRRSVPGGFPIRPLSSASEARACRRSSG